MLFAAAVLLLRGGDCVSLLFADQQSNDCCTRGECSPAKNADPCCQVSNSSAAKHFQPEAKLTAPELSVVSLPVTLVLPAFSDSFTRLPLAVAGESPPGTFGRVSLPLLI